MNRAPDSMRLTLAETIGLVVGLVWLIGAVLVLVVFNVEASGQFVSKLLAVLLPLAMIWGATAAARAVRIIREETAQMHVAIAGMRELVLADRRSREAVGAKPELEQMIKEIAQSTRATQTAIGGLTLSAPPPSRPAPQPAAVADDQPALQLGTSSEDIATPPSHDDLIRALNFPDNAEDREGFAALRRALKHRSSAQLIQASQDLLTLLAQDRIYMDDLHPDPAPPEFWRRFARGERGADVAVLGGVRDRSSLALAAGRMREDAIFRDAAHHFLRRFDTMLLKLEPELSDEDVMRFAETRTARAFMLLGRVTGAFD